MYKIKISESDLSKRGPQVAKMLKPIIGDRYAGVLSYAAVRTIQQEYSIVVRDKITTQDYKNWRFATFHKKFIANYYETWIPVDNKSQQKWYLSKAYLHLYYIDRIAAEEKEYFALHTDPQEPDGGLAIYKQNPHLHIKTIQDPISKAHIAITVGSLRDTLTSTQTLFGAMKHGVEMIRDELMNRY